jgi:hypothetical protein
MTVFANGEYLIHPNVKRRFQRLKKIIPLMKQPKHIVVIVNGEYLIHRSAEKITKAINQKEATILKLKLALSLQEIKIF